MSPTRLFPTHRGQWTVASGQWLLVWGVVAACGAGSDTGTPEAVVRDSAGIRIVEHPAGFVAPVWQVGAVPLLEIGDDDGDSTTLLYQVQGAHRLSDGRIVVANRSSYELRYYDDNGSFLQATGREGGGPGEFGYIAWTNRCGTDSIITYDITNARLSVFDEAGRFVRSSMLTMPDNRRRAGELTCASDGTFLAASRTGMGLVPGPHRPELLMALISPEGEPLRTLGTFPGDERYGHVREDGTGGDVGPRVFGRGSVHTMAEGRIYVGTSDTYEIGGYSLDGNLELLVRKTAGDLEVTQADIDRYLDGVLARAVDANQRRSWEQYYRDYDFPDSLPAYGAFMMDPEDNLWVEDYVRPSDPRHAWSVFGEDGVQRARVELPDGFTVFEIGSDYVLGKWQDELDIEHVRLYELHKPAGLRNAAR